MNTLNRESHPQDRRKNLAKSPYVLTIDGRSGVGKTTFVAELAAGHGIGVIHLDDICIYRPPEFWEPLSVEERFSHSKEWSDLISNILLPLKRGEAVTFTYPSTHNKADYAPPTSINPEEHDVIILEGTFSNAYCVKSLVDFSVLLTCSENQRRRNLVTRNDESMDIWRDIWEPVENKYFTTTAFQARNYDAIIQLQ